MLKLFARNNLLAVLVAVVGLGAAGAAKAVTTTVVVNNQTTSTVSFRETSGQILGTVTPTTPSPIAPSSHGTFSVVSGFSDIASIHFYYETSSFNGCHYDTAYTTGGGYTKAGQSEGSPTRTCSAVISNINLTTHDYTVTFTIR